VRIWSTGKQLLVVMVVVVVASALLFHYLFGAKFGELGHVWHLAESLIDFVGHCEQCTEGALPTSGLRMSLLSFEYCYECLKRTAEVAARRRSRMHARVFLLITWSCYGTTMFSFASKLSG